MHLLLQLSILEEPRCFGIVLFTLYPKGLIFVSASHPERRTAMSKWRWGHTEVFRKRIRLVSWEMRVTSA